MLSIWYLLADVIPVIVELSQLFLDTLFLSLGTGQLKNLSSQCLYCVHLCLTCGYLLTYRLDREENEMEVNY